MIGCYKSDNSFDNQIFINISFINYKLINCVSKNVSYNVKSFLPFILYNNKLSYNFFLTKSLLKSNFYK